MELLGGKLLQAAKEDVGRGIGTGGGGADPADEGAEEGVEGSGAREGEAEGGVHAAVARDEAEGHERGDGDEGEANGDQCFEKDVEDGAYPHAHEQTGQDGGEEDAGAGGGEPVEVEDRSLSRWYGHGGGHAKHDFVEASDRNFQAGGAVDPIRKARHAPEDDAEGKDDPRQSGAENGGAGAGTLRA